MESVFGRNWSQRIPWYPSWHLSQKTRYQSSVSGRNPSLHGVSLAVDKSRKTWKKKTILSFFQTVNRRNFIFSLVTEGIHIPSVCCLPCVAGDQNTLEKPHRHKEKQATAKLYRLTLENTGNNAPQRLTFFSPCCWGDAGYSFWINLKLSVCAGDFVWWSHAAVIRQLMDTEMCMRCPPEMERPRLSFNYLHLLTYSLPVNCHQTYICILRVCGVLRH